MLFLILKISCDQSITFEVTGLPNRGYKIFFFKNSLLEIGKAKIGVTLLSCGQVQNW